MVSGFRIQLILLQTSKPGPWLCLGADTIDSWLGEGTAIDLWRNTKTRSGSLDTSGNLQGLGFTDENNRISVEWTAGGMLALKNIETYYQTSHANWSAEASSDFTLLEAGIEQYRSVLFGTEEAYAYSSIRNWIPFGWYSHDPEVMSLASTGWVCFLEKDFNPFEFP